MNSFTVLKDTKVRSKYIQCPCDITFKKKSKHLLIRKVHQSNTERGVHTSSKWNVIDQFYSFIFDSHNKHPMRNIHVLTRSK